MTRFQYRDVVAGALMFAVGALFLFGSLLLPLGDARRMGPGYFPMLLSILIIALSVVVILRGVRQAVRISVPEIRPFFAIILAIAAFAFGIQKFGLLPATVAAVIFSALGHPESHVRQTLLLAVVICAGVWLIFSVALGLSVPLFRIRF